APAGCVLVAEPRDRLGPEEALRRDARGRQYLLDQRRPYAERRHRCPVRAPCDRARKGVTEGGAEKELPLLRPRALGRRHARRELREAVVGERQAYLEPRTGARERDEARRQAERQLDVVDRVERVDRAARCGVGEQRAQDRRRTDVAEE